MGVRMVEYRFSSVRIMLEKPLKELVKGASRIVFVTGFKGFGMVGYISVVHLVEKLNCSRVGAVLTKYMPEAVTIENYGVTYPFELFACREGDLALIILLCHDLPSGQERSVFTEAIARWLRDVGVDEAVFFGGFDSRYRMADEKLRWVKTSACRRSLDEPMMASGLYIVGPLALLTMYAELYRVPALVILPYAEAGRPDPRAAAIAIEKFSELYGVSVSVEELYEKARIIEEEIIKIEEQKEKSAATFTGAADKVYM